MKKKVYITLGLTAVLGAGIYWSQQSSVPSNVSKGEKTAISKAMPLPISHKEASKTVAKNNTDTTGEEHNKESEEIEAAREKLAAEYRKFTQSQLATDKTFQKIRAVRAQTAAYSDRVKNGLNIDVKETFGVDLDARMQEIQSQMQMKENRLLETHLAGQGVSQEQRAEIASIRAEVFGNPAALSQE